jgi:hypothetical protein
VSPTALPTTCLTAPLISLADATKPSLSMTCSTKSKQKLRAGEGAIVLLRSLSASEVE